MSKKLASTKYWSIKRVFVRGKPSIYAFYSDYTRKNTIENLRKNLFNKYTWRQLKAMGYSVIRVEIKELRK